MHVIIMWRNKEFCKLTRELCGNSAMTTVTWIGWEATMAPQPND